MTAVIVMTVVTVVTIRIVVKVEYCFVNVMKRKKKNFDKRRRKLDEKIVTKQVLLTFFCDEQN